jgi:hypothetical protein
MIILVEGPDCAGKSTLVKHLSAKFHFNEYKESLSYKDRLLPSYNGYDHYMSLTKTLLEDKKNYIIDRFHIGEVVNPIIRKDGRNPLSVSQMIDIEKKLGRETMIINCAPSEEFIKKAFKERGEEVAKEEDIKYLLHLYQLFFYVSSIPTKYEYSLEKDPNYTVIDAFIASVLKSFD